MMMEDNLRKETIEQIERLSKDRVGIDTLERYTGSSADEFQPYVLLTNFKAYVDNFAVMTENPVRQGSVMRAAHCTTRRISIVDFSVGSPVAALVVELLSFIKPRAILMLGMCGGLLKDHEVGQFFNPVAAIREEGTSNAYMPPQVPALSSFTVQRFAVDALERHGLKYHTGVIHTTNVRFWEFNESFRQTLREERAEAIDMECATLFTVGFARFVPVGALMLISDLPLRPDGIKTAESAKSIFDNYTQKHLELGVESLMSMQKREAEGFDFTF